MPDDVEQVFIYQEDASGLPIFFLGLAIDPAVVDVYNLIQDEIVMPLSRIEGVASVVGHGLEEKEILIELDRDRTAASGLNIYELAQQLSGDNFTLSSGNVRHGGKKLLLRSIARYDSVEQLEDRLVAPSIRLRDIATVRYDLPEVTYRVRAMSRPAVALAVMKEGDANTLEVARRVNAVVEELRVNPRLQLIEVATLFDQGEVIMESLTTLLASGQGRRHHRASGPAVLSAQISDDPDRYAVDSRQHRDRADRDVLCRRVAQHPDPSGPDDFRRSAGGQLGRGSREHLQAPS